MVRESITVSTGPGALARGRVEGDALIRIGSEIWQVVRRSVLQHDGEVRLQRLGCDLGAAQADFLLAGKGDQHIAGQGVALQ